MDYKLQAKKITTELQNAGFALMDKVKTVSIKTFKNFMSTNLLIQ